MKGLHLALGLAKFGGGREAFADGLAIDFAGQTEVGAVSRLARLMTMAVWFTAAAIDSGDGTTAQITQLQNLSENAGALVFQGGERLRQRAPPILTYTYVRIITPKKENSQVPLCESRTQLLRVYCSFLRRAIPLGSSGEDHPCCA